jgi:hypothetical protein
MAGTALENFTDFMRVTGPAYMTGPEKMVNDAVKNTYSMSYLLKGKGMDQVIKSGDRILDDIMFDEANTFENYKPNQEFTWTQPQVVTEQAIDWRFSIDHMSWTEHEIELNMGGGRFNATYSAQQYKNLKSKLERRVRTSIANGFEAKLWQAPNSATAAEMESAGGGEQFSIPAFITEDTTNYHNAVGSWTTIMGINPATESKWRNQVATYDFDDPDDTDGDADGLIDAFDNMTTDVQFIPPDYHKDQFEPEDQQFFEDPSRQAIFCSKGGLNQYKRLLRASNDTLVRKQDAAYNRPQWDGVDVVRIAQLDALSMIWKTDTTAAVETSYDPDGYRYFFVNGNYLTPVFHATRYFYKKDPFFLPKQPYTWVCPIDVWWNLFCHSRQRQGIVAPQ